MRTVYRGLTGPTEGYRRNVRALRGYASRSAGRPPSVAAFGAIIRPSTVRPPIVRQPGARQYRPGMAGSVHPPTACNSGRLAPRAASDCAEPTLSECPEALSTPTAGSAPHHDGLHRTDGEAFAWAGVSSAADPTEQRAVGNSGRFSPGGNAPHGARPEVLHDPLPVWSVSKRESSRARCRPRWARYLGSRVRPARRHAGAHRT